MENWLDVKALETKIETGGQLSQRLNRICQLPEEIKVKSGGQAQLKQRTGGKKRQGTGARSDFWPV